MRERAATGFLLCLVLTACLALVAHDAWGDGVALQGPAHEPLSTPSRVALETEVGAFDIAGQRGSYVTVAPLVDWAPNDAMVLRLRVPIQTLFLSGEDARSGIGDIELRAKFRLYADGDRLVVLGGVAEQLPTAESRLGLGGGVIQATPFVTGGYKLGAVIAYLALGDVITLHSAHARPVTNYVDPGSDHELREDLGFIWRVAKAVRVGGALSGVTVLVPSDFGQSLLSGGASVVYSPTPRWRVSLIGQLPIAGEHRFDEKASVGLFYYF